EKPGNSRKPQSAEFERKQKLLEKLWDRGGAGRFVVANPPAVCRSPAKNVMQIKYKLRKWKPWLGWTSVGAILVLTALAALPRLGQSSPIPGLSASLTATGTLLLTVTNAVANEY